MKHYYELTITAYRKTVSAHYHYDFESESSAENTAIMIAVGILDGIGVVRNPKDEGFVEPTYPVWDKEKSLIPDVTRWKGRDGYEAEEARSTYEAGIWSKSVSVFKDGKKVKGFIFNVYKRDLHTANLFDERVRKGKENEGERILRECVSRI